MNIRDKNSITFTSMTINYSSDEGYDDDLTGWQTSIIMQKKISKIKKLKQISTLMRLRLMISPFDTA